LSAILIRADGSDRMGAGHVMRCLALAQGWQAAGGRAVFLQAQSTPMLERRLGAEGIEAAPLDAEPGSPADAQETVRRARADNASWIVADGYHFDAAWQKQIKDSGARLLVWDDYGHAEHYWADLVLNQNLHAAASLYPRREPHTRLLLGTRYVQLRREFLQWRNQSREFSTPARKILVTFGGGNVQGATGMAIEALGLLGDVEAVVVVGGGNPGLPVLQEAVSRLQSSRRSGADISVCPEEQPRKGRQECLPHLLVDPTNMPELMAWADVALSAAGSTAWELAYMGLPSVLIVLADNQSGVAAALQYEGASVNLGHYSRAGARQIADALQSLLADPTRRERMGRAAHTLVDGHGPQRVTARLRAAGIALRRAREDDSRTVWQWANDPEVRGVSFSAGPIPWESHVGWFAAKLQDPNCFFYMAANEAGDAIGQIRFDVVQRDAMISVNLVQAVRGKGYGPALMTGGAEKLFAESDAQVIHAYVKPDNAASIRALQKADFRDAGPTSVHGQPAEHLFLQREPR
jgi:UDP-2,4-diacetamido-2,4,6-trideoxy-beta-L-altropyranose hydrolase